MMAIYLRLYPFTFGFILLLCCENTTGTQYEIQPTANIKWNENSSNNKRKRKKRIMRGKTNETTDFK